MKVVAAKLQSAGVIIIMYLDDWLIIASSEAECRDMIKKTLEIGKAMGLLFNLKKSKLDPTHLIEWLGLVWDTLHETVALSEDNRKRCLKKIRLSK